MKRIKVYGKVGGKLKEWIVEYPDSDGTYFKAIHFLKTQVELDGGAVCEVPDEGEKECAK